MKFLRLAAAVACLFAACAPTHGQNAGAVTNHAYAIGKGPGVAGYTSLLCASGQIALGSAADPVCTTVSGDATLSAAGVLTLSTVNANVGAFGGPNSIPSFTVDGKGRITAAAANVPAIPYTELTGLGTGVSAALGVVVGSAGSVVVNGGAGGTPSSITLTNGTGLPIGGVNGLGAGVAAWLATPNSANLRTALTDETGTGPAVFGTAPNITAPTGIVKGDVGLGNVANVDTTNAANISSGILPNARLGATWTAYTPTIGCGSGTIATLGAVTGQWLDQGPMRFVELVIPITTNGTCAGSITATLPTTPVSLRYSFTGRDSSAGVVLSGAALSTNVMLIQTYSNAYPGGTGFTLTLDGWYRTN